MSDGPNPMAQAEVESEIHRLSNELSKQTVAVAEAARAHAIADVAYKRAFAVAWINHRRREGTVPEKEAFIHMDVADHYEQMRLTEATYKAAQEKGRNLRAQLDALRTIAANVRAVVQGGF